ncbi:hypothetical protein OG373_27445 [Streptomyces avidinii]|uniref:hypothetical protein n=1 Tax=Streptomyces avidinii TaxID=1895 RepID=UPI0038672F50|nr:hypothetical protein OG373_27445 [Streptomyces avidinii]
MASDRAVAPPPAPAPARADGEPLPWRRLARAELLRLRAPRAMRYAGIGLPLAIVAFGLSKLLLHDRDTAAAWRSAEDRYATFLADAQTYGLPVGSGLSARNYFRDPRYLMDTLSFGDLRTVVTALAAAAVVFGMVAGGADWSSRVMLTLAAAEPRRFRLFATRALLVAALSMAATAAAGLLLVPLLLLAAFTRGSAAGLDGVYWAALASQYARGVLLVGLLCLLGYGLAMLTRRASVALAIGFLYLAGSDRIFAGRGPRGAEYAMDGLVFAVLNEKPVIPMAQSECIAGPGCEAVHVDLTAADGFLGVLIYLVPVLLVALWRFTRTDIT